MVGNSEIAIPSATVDNGDGTHTFTLTATTNPGVGRWTIVVQENNLLIQLFPDLELEVEEPGLLLGDAVLELVELEGGAVE